MLLNAGVCASECLVCYRLPQSVPSVDKTVVAGHVAAGRGAEVDGQAVEVVDGAEALLGGVVDPDTLLSLEGRDAVEGGVHVAGGDSVDPDLVAGPLGGQGLCHLDDGGLGGVVAGLLLRVVDDAARHGGDEDDGAAVLGVDHVAADGLGDQKGAGDVDVEKTAELLGVVVLGLDVGAGVC